MKKIAAFLTALALFVTVAAGAHAMVVGRLDTNNPNFGTWISSKKDLSYKAISSNMEEDTFMMMGSSEFQHGRKTKYHPTAVFRSLNMNVMCTGSAQNQSLTHAITMGAVAPELKTKKAVIILSPSWFVKSGIRQSGFAARFSLSQYEELLKNENIDRTTKEKIAERVNSLLEISPSSFDSAKRAEKVYLTGDTTFRDRIYYRINKWINEEKENMNVGLLWKATGEKNYAKYTAKEPGEALDWDSLASEADSWLTDKMTNDFYMKDSLYKKKVVPILSEKKDSAAGKSYAVSPEYDDLRLFLDICQQEGVEVMMVLLPVNGYWYDYTGFTEENRQTVVTGVTQVASEYDVKLVSFFHEAYSKGFLEDATHPAGKGWIRINEACYQFFSED